MFCSTIIFTEETQMLYIPRDYRPILDVTETQKAIALVRSEFEKSLSAALNL